MAFRRRDVILASAAVFIAWGFATNWISALRLVPYAFISGITLTVAFLLWAILSTSLGLEKSSVNFYGLRNVAFITPEKWQAEKESLEEQSAYQRGPIYPHSFLISDKLDGLIDLIIRDFVKSWFNRISKRSLFANEIDRAVRAALTQILQRLVVVDLVEFGTLKLVPIITSHLKDFYEAERAVRGRKLSRDMTESEELDLAIAGKFKDGKLHAAASLAYSDPKHTQQQHLRSIVARLLPKILPSKMITSPSVNVLTKELMACAVLSPITQSLSDPDTWNQLIEIFGQNMLQERKSVRKLRAALDEHAPPSPAKSNRNVQFPKLSPSDNERKFERFVKSIKQCNSLSDARRFRNEVASQLRKDSAMELQDPVYVRRLETAKRLLDQRVAMLGAGGSMKRPNVAPIQQPNLRARSRLENLTLRDILHDASGMSYFMEFMDRQGLMRLVQFWIVVDGIRNPLEGDQDDIAGHLGALSPWTESERTDLAQIHEGYITKPELKITSETHQIINDFLGAGKAATPLQYHSARKAILQAQTATYNDMVEVYFLKFKRSDLFFKYLASDEHSAAASSSTIVTLSPNENVSPTTMPPPPQRMSRISSARAVSQAPDLRKAVASSSDLGQVGKLGNETPVRRSLDAPASRAPLFDDDYDSEPMSRSTQSLGSSDVEGSKGQLSDTRVVDAMQAALNDIIEDKPDRDSLFPDTPRFMDEDVGENIFDTNRPSSPFGTNSKREKPSIASLGLVGAPSTLGVFNDDLFGDEEKFLEDEVEESDGGKTDEEEIHEAAPGDLGLAEAIDVLTQDIEKLVTQESIIDSLTNKAELTNNAAELRILRKSKASLQREIRRKELQRQQYIVQESDNSLYGRASVSIKSIMVGNEDDGREFAMYVIEVRRQAGDQMPSAVWVVTRRYSEFHDLNKRLRSKYPHIRGLEFPRRQMVLKLQRDFLQKRRVALERYLRELLLIPAVCRSRELRAFLSEQAISSVDSSSAQTNTRDFVTRIYSSVTDGMEEFLGNIPVLDQLTVAGQNLISAATSQLVSNTGSSSPISGSMAAHDPQSAAEAEAELQAYENRELEPFVKPICDVFLELFELNRENNWLRGRAVVVVLHQLLGGTVERKVRENAKAFVQEESIVKYLDLAKNLMWPDGKFRQPVVRTQAEKNKSRKEAELVLRTLMPELVGTVVGRANAQAASRRITATLNNPRLNTHLIFTILDEIVAVVFGNALSR